MRRCPFPISPQRLPWRDEEMARRFASVRQDAERRLAGVRCSDDGRRGIGTVYAVGELRQVADTLNAWSWRAGDPAHHPHALGARLFVDDPLGATPRACLDARARMAAAFAEAANAFFEPADGRFAARPLEVVRADEGRPAGIHPGEDADVLAIDLMEGLSNSEVVDRLVEERHGGDFGVLSSMLCAPFAYVEVWQRLERLNSARALLAPALPVLKLPGLAALRRRARDAHGRLYPERSG